MLAYGARIHRDVAHVVVGSHVAVSDRFICDGVWADAYEDGRFHEHHLAGTGLLLDGDHLLAVSSSVPSDRILLSRDGDDIVLSNSLPFLLEMLDDRLDPDFLYYRNHFLAADCGLSIAPHTVPTAGNHRIRTLLGEIAQIGADGAISVVSRPVDGPFESFHLYQDFLSSSLQALLLNARSKERQSIFQPLGTLSSGYDSTASAVLSRDAGVTDFITMLRSETSGDSVRLVDHPAEIAQHLDVVVDEVPRGRWKDRTDLPDAEFAAAGATFMDVVWLTIEDRLPHRLLLTGNYGDNVWTRSDYRITEDISQAFGTFDNRGFPEWRLRVGFTFCGLPSIGHSAKGSLYRISNSIEMHPWSVGGSYDRPIARRIAEEAGIPRGSFAVRKFGGSGRVGTSRHHYPWGDRSDMLEDLSEVMTPRGAESFLDFCVHHQAESHDIAYRVGRMGTFAYQKADALNHRIGRRMHRRDIRALVPPRAMVALAGRYRTRLDYTYLWPHWGTEMLRSRFTEAAVHVNSIGG